MNESTEPPSPPPKHEDPTSEIDWKKVGQDYSLEARRELEHAAEFMAQSLAAYAFQKLVRIIISQTPFDGKVCALRWYDGVWIGGKRGLILTANDRAILFAYIEGGGCREPYERKYSSALFAIRLLEFKRD